MAVCFTLTLITTLGFLWGLLRFLKHGSEIHIGVNRVSQ